MNAINCDQVYMRSLATRQSNLALSAHVNQAIDILKRYLDLDPSNQQALRLSIQNAGIVRDRDFADKALDLMTRHNPSALPLANSYIENAFSD